MRVACLAWNLFSFKNSTDLLEENLERTPWRVIVLGRSANILGALYTQRPLPLNGSLGPNI
jgi:hypothetical protein